MRSVLILVCLIALSAESYGHDAHGPTIYIPFVPARPVAPVAPAIPQPPVPQAYRIHYPTPLRSFLFGSRLIPVPQYAPPPTSIQTPYFWGPIE